MLGFLPTRFREPINRLPTTDLYFLNPLAELRRQGVAVPSFRPLAPNVYLAGRTGVIVRYGSAEDVALLKEAGARQVVYIVDDDFSAAASDQALPEGYRKRLAAFAKDNWRALEQAADVVIVPGSVLAEMYGAKAVIMVPAWGYPPASTEHFRSSAIEIAHLGTGSHRGDLAMLSGSLAKLLRAHPNARLTLFAGDAAPDTLKHHPQVNSRKPLSWWRYKRALPRMRFHLALYPLAPTPFNRARSANKLYEHAIVGAASLMAPNPALKAATGDGLAEIFVEGGADEWMARIESLLTDREELRQRVELTRAHILADNPLARAAETWRKILSDDR
jgi:hypothetical protein